VGDATGRKVVAYMSQVHTDPDIALEFFELEPGTHVLSDEHEVLEPVPGESSTVNGYEAHSSEPVED
jgi:hypothetical protein